MRDHRARGGMRQRAMTPRQQPLQRRHLRARQRARPRRFASSIPMEREFTSVTAAPGPRPGMPGPRLLGHQRQHRAVSVDQVMRRHLGRRVAQPLQRRGAARPWRCSGSRPGRAAPRPAARRNSARDASGRIGYCSAARNGRGSQAQAKPSPSGSSPLRSRSGPPRLQERLLRQVGRAHSACRPHRREVSRIADRL